MNLEHGGQPGLGESFSFPRLLEPFSHRTSEFQSDNLVMYLLNVYQTRTTQSSLCAKIFLFKVVPFMTPPWIQRLRRHLKLSQRAFAERLGTSQSHVAGWEKNAYRPSHAYSEKLIDLAREAGFEVDKKIAETTRADSCGGTFVREQTEGPTEQVLLRMLERQQQMMERQREDMAALTHLVAQQTKVVSDQRQDMADLTQALTRHLERVGAVNELDLKRDARRLAELESKVARLEKPRKHQQQLLASSP